MRKLLSLSAILVLLLYTVAGTDALAKPRATAAATVKSYRVTGADANSEAVASAVKVVTELLASANRHDLDGIMKYYSGHFVSGDNLGIHDVEGLIKETWQTYPDIKYESQIQEVRMNGDWCTIESIDGATATVQGKEGILQTPGTMRSNSRGQIFLHRIQNNWEIVGDYTIYENAVIGYGNAKNLDVILSAPDLVFSGESYTAKVGVELLPGMVAIASISQDPLVYPQRNPSDKYRSISGNQTDLQRVFQANTTNNNEIVTATIGLTEISKSEDDQPLINFSGVITVVKRVNVLPRTTYSPETGGKNIIRSSASGLIDLRKTPLEQDKDGQNKDEMEEEGKQPSDSSHQSFIEEYLRQ